MTNGEAAKQKARHLPMDLWTEILVRVPAEDLPRMRFMCKSWHALIKRNRSFAQSHIDHWRSRVCPGFVVCWDSSSMSYLTFVSTRDGCGAEGLRTRSLDFSLRRNQIEDSPVEVLGSCDALLLLKYPQRGELEIYNPATGSRMNLPPPPSVALFSTHKGFHIVPDTASAGRYKILVITSQDRLCFPHPRDGHCLGTKVRCWCYCFRRFDELDELPRGGKQSGWKELDMHWLKRCWKIEETSTHRGGKLRILFSGRTYEHMSTCSGIRLLSLDITNEAFSHSYPFKPRPRGSSTCPSTCGHMSAWNGGFYYFEPSKHFREFGLWELENLDGKLPRWIPRLIVPSSIPSYRFTTSGKALLVIDGTRLIFGFGGRSFYVYDRILKEWGSVETDRKYAYAEKFLPHVYSLSMLSAAEEASAGID